jgi:hypothetical protein
MGPCQHDLAAVDRESSLSTLHHYGCHAHHRRWVHPWYALWRDEHGRPRTLNPYGGQEATWRFQASPPPQHPTLEQAIRVWEATQRA